MTLTQSHLQKAKAALDKAQAEYKAAVRATPMYSARNRHKEQHFQSIVLALKTIGPMMPSDIAHNLRIHRVSVHRYLREMLLRDLIVKTGAGLYALPPKGKKT